jgi:hypothetical protein
MQKPIVVLALSLAFGVQAFAAARSTFVDQAVETDRRAALAARFFNDAAAILRVTI